MDDRGDLGALTAETGRLFAWWLQAASLTSDVGVRGGSYFTYRLCPYTV